MSTTENEKTFIMVKPDGVQRGLVGEILRRFERVGYKLVALKLMKPSKELLLKHYEEHIGKKFFNDLLDYIMSGPVVAMVWEGKDVVEAGRKLLGATNPLKSAPGTIRGDFGIMTGRNIVHGSDSVNSAVREISLWFKPDELLDWKKCDHEWLYED